MSPFHGTFGTRISERDQLLKNQKNQAPVVPRGTVLASDCVRYAEEAGGTRLRVAQAVQQAG